jgi:hypothetical protein
MTPLHIFRWLMVTAIAGLLSATVQSAAAGHMGGGHGGMGGGHGGMGGGHGGMGGGHGGMGGGHGGMGPVHGGMGPVHGGMGGHVGMGPGFDHRHDFAFRHDGRFRDRDDRFFRDRDFDDDDRFFRHHNRFFFDFDFVAFGFPSYYPYYPYYPYYDPYYGSPYDYSYSDYGGAYDYQYWNNLAVSVQSELSRRGYYHGAIDGAIGSGSRQAIRAFQAAQGLQVSGKIDPKLLKTLGIKYKTA